ncbi:hypothetical protein DFH06DRAFT_1196487 [Mycena polygramma]|nr:hypothetical protein DFH06DRAFT_1196487 [Mycena polygramma]
MRAAILALQVFLFIAHVCAEPHNITIDDTSPLFDYSGVQIISRCTPALSCNNQGIDAKKCLNSSLTIAGGGTVILNFTGTAIYVFWVAHNDYLHTTFSLDNVVQKHIDGTPSPEGEPAVYNVTVFQATDLTQGPHLFDMSGDGDMSLDYAVITTNSDVASSAGFSSTGSVPTSGGTTPTSNAASPDSTSNTHDQPSTHSTLTTGAIAGVAVGAVATCAMIGIGLFLCLRAKRPSRDPPHQSAPPDIPGAEAADLAAEMRMVRAQMEHLAAQQQAIHQVNHRASLFSDTESSATRSLSTMKRDQTRVLHATNSMATDSLVHTDGGLRLTAGSAMDEAPPEYVRG